MTAQHLRQRSFEIEGVHLGYSTLFGDGASAAALFLRSLGLPKRPLLATWNGHLSFSMTAPEKL